MLCSSPGGCGPGRSRPFENGKSLVLESGARAESRGESRVALRPGRAQDVRYRWHRRPRREGEPLAPFQRETGALECRAGVATHMATPCYPRPEGRVGETLEHGGQGMVRDHVLVKPQFAAFTQHPAKLRKRTLLVGDRAQHEGRDCRVDAPL